MTDTAGAGRARRTVAETRELLLRAAVDVLRERAEQAGDHVVAAALAHVRFTQVAERATALVRSTTGPRAASVTTGAIYNLWPNHEDFQVDLLLHVADLQAQLVPGLDETVPRFRDAAARSVPVWEVLRELVEDVHRHYGNDPIFRVELGFLIGAHDPRVQHALTRRFEAFAAAADRVWQALLDAYRLRLREPFGIRDLTTAMASVLVGATVLAFADSRALADPAREPGWSLTFRTASAVFERFVQDGA